DGTCSCRRADCHSPGKHPRTINGLRDASTDPSEIAGWWQGWPSANIGLAIPDGYVVLDIDTADRALAVGGRALPATATQSTPRPGWHLVYRTDREIRPTVAILDHVDVR